MTTSCCKSSIINSFEPPTPGKAATFRPIQHHLESLIPIPSTLVSTLDSGKKSHARKRPAGHIPRPRNAFIIFRCDFVRQNMVPQSIENDHRNISRIAGRVWKQMTDSQKAPWQELAQQEKLNHSKAHPGYRPLPTLSHRRKQKQKRGDDVPQPVQKTKPADDAFLPLQRSASCPPGVLKVPQVNLEYFTGYGSPLVTRDDLSRRPSRITLYQHKPCYLEEETVKLEFLEDTINQHYLVDPLPDERMVPLTPDSDRERQRLSEKVDDDYQVYNSAGLFAGLHFGIDGIPSSYPIPDLNVLPEWIDSHAKYDSFTLESYNPLFSDPNPDITSWFLEPVVDNLFASSLPLLPCSESRLYSLFSNPPIVLDQSSHIDTNDNHHQGSSMA